LPQRDVINLRRPTFHTSISIPTRAEFLDASCQRYQQAPRSEKTKVLDELVISACPPRAAGAAVEKDVTVTLKISDKASGLTLEA
jgi:hypothetical protein